MAIRSADHVDADQQKLTPIAKLRGVLRAVIEKNDFLQLSVWNLQEAGVTRVKIGRASPASSFAVLTIPGVFKPWDDSVLLGEALSAEGLKPGAAVLDLCTGSGVLSVLAARLGAGSVTAVDLSRAALVCTRVNSALHRSSVRTRRGDLYAALGEGALFDVIVSNPPWRPSATDKLPTRGIRRAWDAGPDARALIDRVCAGASSHLHPGGYLLIVQASFCDVRATVQSLARQGLIVDVIARLEAPITQLDALAMELEEQWATGDSTYEIVVIRAARPRPQPG